MQSVNGENQVPVLTPNDVPELNLELLEFILVQVSIILGVWVLPDESTNVNRLRRAVRKFQLDTERCDIFCGNNT